MQISKHNQLENALGKTIFVLPQMDPSSNNVNHWDGGESILKTYLQFGYYLGLIPFKIIKNKLDGTIFTYSNRVQQVCSLNTNTIARTG